MSMGTNPRSGRHASGNRGRGCSPLELRRVASRQRAELAASHIEVSSQLLAVGQFELAEDSAVKACRACPDDPEVWCNLGSVLLRMGRHVEAVNACEQALRLKPDTAHVWSRLGVVWQALTRWEQAISCLDYALMLDPESTAAHVNRGIIHFLFAEYEQGWPHYDWRLQLDGAGVDVSSTSVARLDDLTGKCVLLQAEQGFGDVIQMVRYAKVLRDRAASLLIRCPDRLVALLTESGLADQVLSDEKDDREDIAVDVNVPTMSLLRLCRTTVDNVPAATPYLTAAPVRVQYWRRELAPLSGFRVGIAWQGNPEMAWDAERSIPLASFAPLFQPGVDVVSLQRGRGTEQIDGVRGQLPLHLLGTDVDADDAFVDTAAIMKNLDLVVTCDTSIAHLAGALGVPVWIALDTSPHWVWMLERNDSPWYPSARLFRQKTSGDWNTVFGEIAERLATVVSPPQPVRAHTPTARSDDCGRLQSMVRTWNGWMICPVNDVYVGQSLLRWGEYSRAEAELLCGYLAPGDAVVECGAHVGPMTLPMARSVGPSGRIHAFEPQSVLFQMLCGNLALNDITWVDCRQAAVGAVPGKTGFAVPDYLREGNFGAVSMENDAGTLVPLETIDELQLGDCHLIKADVEGMEREVLEGAQQTLEACRPILYVEADREERTADLIRFIQAAGYRLFWHLPPIVQPDNHFGLPLGDVGAFVSANLLCLPGELPLEVPPGLREVRSPDENWRTLLADGNRVQVATEPKRTGAAGLLLTPTSPAELLDRMSILKLKMERLPTEHRRTSAAAQHKQLAAVAARVHPSPKLTALIAELDQINASIWDLEDEIRDHEARQDFGAGFIDLSRSIYRFNDKRARVKTTINQLLQAAFNDDKAYRSGDVSHGL